MNNVDNYFLLIFLANDEPEEEPSSTADVDETEESAPITSRGVARKNVRRARGQRAAAARARVVSTRLHGGRRQVPTRSKPVVEETNTTLEETVNTETEESPKKPTRTSPVKEKKSTVPTPPKEESTQENTASNVRVSGTCEIIHDFR